MSNLRRLLRPSSIAVVGGGPWCTSVIEQCRKAGFKGPLWAVHPNKEQVGGITAYPSIAALPGVPDAAFLGINRHATLDALAALVDRQAGGAICFASGFEEAADGAELHDRFLDAAGDLAVLGPNCYGLLNYLDGVALWPDQHGGQMAPDGNSGVAIVSQSGNIAISLTMQRRGLPIAYMVSVGNQAQQSLTSVGAELLRDDRVSALGLYVESFGDLRTFEALAAQAQVSGKSIVALKVGKSPLAQAATLSHTA